MELQISRHDYGMLLADSDKREGKEQTMSYRVNMIWDREAEVWVATSEDVPGLVLESGSFDALLERVKYAIPELKELNGQKPGAYTITFFAERNEQVAAYG